MSNTQKPFLCLGIESTAHTFSVGIVSSEGQILSIASDTYIPESGGLHPQKVVEHHYTCFEAMLTKAISDANITYQDLGLIAFSRGPGLGPCLRIGAGVARSLALKLKIPLVGVNHCIAHVEIGRLMAKTEDPVTLYISGGNTIVSAFDSGKYQVFGETLDLAVGNMLDMVARELDIPHPGGPRIEQIAKEGKQYIPLPYIVKGMDLSFSGLFTFVATKLAQQKAKTGLEISNLIYSLQETAFAMLTEVTERALAHTQKRHILLTGGVAANKRIQEMLAYIGAEHHAQFNVVPLKVAGDNGAMIAWAGLLQYLHAGEDQIEDTQILPKWRMDEVAIPWRTSPKIDITKLSPSLPIPKNPPKVNLASSPILLPKTDLELLDELEISGSIIARGAEADLIKTTWADREVIIKFRIPKLYRISEIDTMLRNQRTLFESRALLDLGALGIPVPPIYDVEPSKGYIMMKYIPGKRLRDLMGEYSSERLQQIFYDIGAILAKIHQNDHTHGDLTTSNIIMTPTNDIFFIDFGLTQPSITLEDKAVDLHLFKRVLTSTHAGYYHIVYPSFLQGYRATFGCEAEEIINQVEQIELRGRYIAKEKRRKE